MSVRDLRDRELVLDRLRAAIAEAGSAAAWGRRHKISRQYVWDVLCERRWAGVQMLTALGIDVEIRLVEASS
ncbi:hypothetical protein [Methylobacterium aquaticum]|uniref:Uncharacterized protein n=1 Tax=Methylobacterium aquaticum TaxID=270351 RepID=A0A0C6FMJ9_9HYPH|nr:hypothetical protein [Methylobacterium aquaticum]BAQ49603.1 hypothetical protein Maq22A_1p37060 [Methylobacterium aquaticum]